MPRPRFLLKFAGLGLLLLLLAGLAAVWHLRFPHAVPVAAETDPVPSPGDAADDPAVWVHPDDPSRSLILATDKKGGLCVFGMDGRQLQYLAVGKINNVDVRDGFPFAAGVAPLAAATNKTDDCIDLFRIDVWAGTVVAAGKVLPPADVLPDGICLYRSQRTREFHAFVTTKRGELVQFRIGPEGGELTRRLFVGSICEACVADDERGVVYVAEENVGIWRYGAEPDAGEERFLVDSTGLFGRLHHDVEGLAIYRATAGTGYLVVSNQGRDDFLVYRREGDNSCVGRFRLTACGSVDSVRHTDGIEIVSTAVGPRFPDGLLIVQDDENDSANQNFKLVSWTDVSRSLRRLF